MAVILVVDDHDEIRNMLETVLGKDGHEILTASSTAQAEPLLAKKPALVLADIDMPGETGVEFVFRMRRYLGHQDLPVIFITAYPERARALQLTGHGAVKIFAKPFRIFDLRETVTSMLGLPPKADQTP